MNAYDLAIIGSGPGGYIAAIRAAQLGFKTVLIEKYSTLGGTCLNVGCIPSKTLLDSSEHYHQAQKNFSIPAILSNGLSLYFKELISRKDQVVKQTCDGVKYLMDKNKIDVYYGWGTFKDKNHLSIDVGDKSIEEIEFRYAIIATGSKPSSLSGLDIDKKRIISSTQALALDEVPKRLIVIGGGVISLELGSVYNRLGSEVTVVEFMDRLIPTMDHTLSKELQKILKKSGIQFHLSTRVKVADVQGSEVIVTTETQDGKSLQITGDHCLVAVGRKPFTEGLGLEKLKIEKDSKGFVSVDENLQTRVENVYAIGDVIGGAMLAHKAEEEGLCVVERLAGQKPHIDYNLIPSVVYTWPEVAGVGKTETQLKEKGISYKTGQFPMRALGRARASGDLDGLVKILADEKTDEILGVHMIGARAADMIMEAVTAMEFRASAEDIARISHPHPTFTEAIREAALSATGDRPLHI
ncbi:MAG: dihydrolipoyl dehydrogenase [Flavobacteriales bacterium AspAUS03]